jgi:hypothetical protein
MMNVNLDLSCAELELLNLSLRCNLRELQSLANSQYLDETSKNRYKSQVTMAPRILEVLTTLQVQRMIHDYSVVETVAS